MTTAAVDENANQSMIGRLNTDGSTIQRVEVNPTTHVLHINDNTTGTDHGGTFAATDENGRTAMFVESSAGDTTLVALYVDSTGALLTDSV